MCRIHFTGEDLLRVSLARDPDPEWELELSLIVLQSRDDDPGLSQWRRHVIRGVRRAYLWHVVQAMRATSRGELSARVREAMAPERRRQGRGGAASDEVRTSLEAYYRAALAPFWRGIRATVREDRAERVELLASGGLGRLLAGLHPRIRWRAPVLEFDESRNRTIQLAGRGLLLQPSFFCGTSPVQVADHGVDDLPTLVFPIARPPPTVCPDGATDPTAALLGRTRATALEATNHGGCTTTELAQQCHVSVSTASHQATVLREGGLIGTERVGTAVVHEITELGRRLLDRSGDPQHPWE